MLTRARARSAKRSYRRRVKSSRCRGKKRTACRRARRCKTAKGKKRTFCRKRRNTRRHRGGQRRSRGGMSGVLNEAALPFGILALQKYYQNKRKHRKSKK